MVHVPEEGRKCLIYKAREFHGICQLQQGAQSSPGLCGAAEQSWAAPRAMEEPLHSSSGVELRERQLSRVSARETRAQQDLQWHRDQQEEGRAVAEPCSKGPVVPLAVCHLLTLC